MDRTYYIVNKVFLGCHFDEVRGEIFSARSSKRVTGRFLTLLEMKKSTLFNLRCTYAIDEGFCNNTIPKKMIAAKAIFEQQKNNQVKQELINSIESYLSHLLKNGQIYNEYIFARSESEFTAYVYLARPDAFEEKYHSSWGKAELQKLSKEFRVDICWQILDDDTQLWHQIWHKKY